MKIYTIPQKMINSGSIHDIASDMFDREIRFPKGSLYAVVDASYYGGKGYTTHRTAQAAAKKSAASGCAGCIIDTEGTVYDVRYEYDGMSLEPR